jgi:hypothetical protein
MNKITPRTIAIFMSDVMMKKKFIVFLSLPGRRSFAFDARRAHTRAGFVDLFVDCTAPCLNLDSFFDRFLVLRLSGRQLFNLQNVHPGIADFTQTQSAELWDCFADAAEHLFDRMKRVAASGCLQQVA